MSTPPPEASVSEVWRALCFTGRRCGLSPPRRERSPPTPRRKCVSTSPSQAASCHHLYSAWAVSRRAQTDDPPVAPVAPPVNLRWGSVGENYVTIHWDYQPLPGFATATGFQVRACQNSIATVGCVPPHTAARTARFQRVTPVEGSKSYWGFVRTIASMPDPQNPQNPPIVRYSNWVAVGARPAGRTPPPT